MFEDLSQEQAGHGADQATDSGPRSTSTQQSGYPLTLARAGERLVICGMHGGCRYRRKLMDMGLRPGISIEVLRSGGYGPMLVTAGETRLGIGWGMAEKIEVIPDNQAGRG